MASRQLNGISSTLSASADLIYAKLLSPFTDVFCFFAEDVGNFVPIVRRLALWLDLGQCSTLPKSTRPKVLIITERQFDRPPNDEAGLQVFKQMLSEETTLDVSNLFSDIQVLSLASHKMILSNRSRHRELFEHLLNFSDQVRDARISTQTLFSAHHFSAFFGHALHHLLTNFPEPFNFITTSRINNPVSENLQDHLKDFIQNIKTPRNLIDFAVPVIASSFLLDNYPPDMHCQVTASYD